MDHSNDAVQASAGSLPLPDLDICVLVTRDNEQLHERTSLITVHQQAWDFELHPSTDICDLLVNVIDGS